MEREAIIQDSRERTQCENAESDLAVAYREVIQDCLGEEAFPGKFGDRLGKESIMLYVEHRGAIQSNDETTHYEFEKLFHEHFFPQTINSAVTLIFLRGKEGIGKSTFIRFYFDYFIHHHMELFGLSTHRSEDSPAEDDRQNLLVLYCNLRRQIDWPHTLAFFCRDLRDQILRFRPSISIERDHAMWSRIARWNDPMHASAEQAYPSRAVYRAHHLENHFSNDLTFVNEALWYLGSQRTPNLDRQFYVTVIADNADQLDSLVQKNLMKHLLHWGAMVSDAGHFERGPAVPLLWKIIVPVRPETLRNLQHDLIPITQTVTVDLEMPDSALVLNRRASSAKVAVRDTNTQVDRVLRDSSGGFSVYAPVTSTEVADWLDQAISLDFLPSTTSNQPGLTVSHPARIFMEEFCNNSLRRLLRLKKQIALSKGFSERMRNAVQRPSRHIINITEYTFLDACVVGKAGYFDKHAPESDMVNIFDCTKDGKSCSAFTTLLGVHVLFLISRRVYRHSALINLLTSMGFAAEDVTDCLTLYFNKGIFKRVNLDESDDYLVQRDEAICNALIRVSDNPAYIDNMAIVTPVDLDLKEVMSVTVGYSINEFKNRVDTSLAFLEQLRRDEAFFTTWDRERHKICPTDFKTLINGKNLPSIFARSAYRYRCRIEKLRKEPRNLIEVMDERDWLSILERSILAVSPNRAQEPLRAIVNTNP